MHTTKVPDLHIRQDDEGYYVITSALLDLVGTGVTLRDAEQSFADELAFVRSRYSSLPDSELTQRLRALKFTLKTLSIS